MDLNTTNITTTTGLNNLPSQPLPRDDNDAARVAVIVWLLLTVLFVALFYSQVSRMAVETPMKRGARSITWSAILLSLRYVTLVIDRWLHHRGTKAPYGYILVDPIFEPFDLGSTILILWGTYLLVASQVAGFMVPKRSDFRWWVPRVTVVLLCFLTAAHFELYLAQAIYWIQFYKLEMINDLTKYRDTSDRAMWVLFFVSSLVILFLACFGWVKTRHHHGDSRKYIIYLSVASLFLVVRNGFAMGTVGNKGRSNHYILKRDVVYGVFTELYFFFAYMASREIVIETRDDRESRDCVESDVRNFIIEKLATDTNNRILPSPAFVDLLNELRNLTTLNNIIATGTLSQTLGIDIEAKRAFALTYIDTLQSRYGELNPKLGKTFEEARSPSSVPSMMFNKFRESVTGGRNSAPGRSTRPGTSSPQSFRSRHFRSDEALGRRFFAA